MKTYLSCFFFLILSPLFLWANSLQEAIDNAPVGATIKLSKGIYRGNITISKPLTLLGNTSGVVIEGEKRGSVITITASHVRLENLTITNSGDQIITLDAAIVMKQVSHCTITQCRIKNSLYGIDMNMVNDSNITHNTITSNGKEKSMRGDALKIWYSNRNSITHNSITASRDITLVFSNDTLFLENNITYGRHGLAMERSKHTLIQRNLFRYNSTGIMTMASEDTNITHNQILSCQGAAGIGMVIQGGGRLRFEHNQISYNAKAFYIDTKDYEKGMRRIFRHNSITHNKEAFHFHLTIKNNTIIHNTITGNLDDVVKDIEGAKTKENRIEKNYWDRYQGFDRDGDNIGDTPHRIYQYADQLWHYNHKIKFFYASPIMSLLNFLSNLAPFIEPHLLLEDRKPIVNSEF
jgi:nitrous oxidase accessory protein